MWNSKFIPVKGRRFCITGLGPLHVYLDEVDEREAEHSHHLVQCLDVDPLKTVRQHPVMCELAERVVAGVRALCQDGGASEFAARVRIDTPRESDYFRHGGILLYVLRALLDR